MDTIFQFLRMPSERSEYFTANKEADHESPWGRTKYFMTINVFRWHSVMWIMCICYPFCFWVNTGPYYNISLLLYTKPLIAIWLLWNYCKSILLTTSGPLNHYSWGPDGIWPHYYSKVKYQENNFNLFVVSLPYLLSIVIHLDEHSRVSLYILV